MGSKVHGKKIAVGLVAAVLLTVQSTTHAATIKWDGGTGGTGTTWETANNWSGNALPGSADDILLDNSLITLPSSMTTSGFNQSIKSITLDASNSITLGNTGTGAGASSKITLLGKGDAGNTMFDLTNNATGTFTIQPQTGGNRNLTLELGASGTFNVANSAGVLNITTSISETGGARAITKTGDGTLILTNASNAYTGGTTISGGMLIAGNANALGTTGTIAVNNGGTLGIASGVTFTRAVTFNTGAGLAGKGTYNPSGSFTVTNVRPGLGDIGTLTFGKSATGTNFHFDLDKTSGVRTGDQLAFGANTLTLGSGATLNLNITGNGFAAGDSWTLFSFTGSISGTFSSIGTAPSGFNWNTSNLYSGGVLSLTAANNNSQIKITTAPDSITTSENGSSGTSTTRSFGRVLLNSTQTTGSYTISKTGTDTTTYTIVTAGDVASTTLSGTSFAANSQSISGTITLNTSSTGSKSGTVTIDNTASNSAASGQGSDDTNDVITVTGTVVNQRNFSIGTPTIALGRFLVNTTPTGSTAISSNGLNNVTANATINSFTGTNTSSLTLATSDPTAFNGGSASQTANYIIGGTVTSAGALSSATFTAPVTAELGSISNLVVNVTGTAVNQRSFSAPASISLGRFMLSQTPTGSANVSSNGLNNVTANATVNSFSGTNTNGLTLSLGSGSNSFNGGSASQTAVYNVGGTAGSAGAISGSFSANVTAELGSINPISIGVTGSALNKRTLTGPATLNLGNVLKGAVVTVNSSLSVNSSGGANDTTQVQLAGAPITSQSGLSLSGSAYDFNGTNANNTTRTITGTLNTGSFGQINGGWSNSVTTLENGGAGLTGEGSYNPIAINFTANVGNATVGTGNTFGTALSATIAGNGYYTGLASQTSRDLPNNVLGTTAEIVESLASTNGISHSVSMAWRTRTANEIYPGAFALLSDVVEVSNVQGVYVLKMSYNPADVVGNESQLYLAWLNGGMWRHAVDGNGGGTAQRINGDWLTAIDGSLDTGDLGKYGVDTANDYVWAVLDHNSEFAVIPEPSSLTLLGLGAAGLLARRRRR